MPHIYISIPSDNIIKDWADEGGKQRLNLRNRVVRAHHDERNTITMVSGSFPENKSGLALLPSLTGEFDVPLGLDPCEIPS